MSGNCSASGFHGSEARTSDELLYVLVKVVHQGKVHELVGLVDTGCQLTIIQGSAINVAHQIVLQADPAPIVVSGIHGEACMTVGRQNMALQVGNGPLLQHRCAIAKKTPGSCNIVLGIDFLRRFSHIRVGDIELKCNGQLGGAAVNRKPGPEGRKLFIDDKDFVGTFNGKYWTIRWRWKDKPALLKNRVALYRSANLPMTQQRFESEIKDWIDKGWLQSIPGPPGRNADPKGGLIPLMAVVQPTKDKVRPVMDFRELNNFVQCHSGDEVAVCDESLRRWRRLGTKVKIVDLKSAYLQLRVARDLWSYQQVEFQGKRYWLTRLGFGLNCAPRIMTRVLREVLEQNAVINAATEPYIDDILVDENLVAAEVLVNHLKAFGLTAKAPEGLDGGRALGLKITKRADGTYWFSRGNTLGEWQSGSTLTREKLFSLCGKVVGHYPVAGWARVACSFVKRVAEGYGWKDDVGPLAKKMAAELLTRVEKEDPVKGVWEVPKSDSGVVWTDASSLAMGAVLEIGGHIVEDAAWLRPKDDAMHINLAELEAALKGLNLALKWGLKKIVMLVDSKTVFDWMKLTLSGEKRVKTKGAAEMLVKRRLAVLSQTVKEFGLQLKLGLVASAKNKADKMTRVPQVWLTALRKKDVVVAVADTRGRAQLVKKLHERHHLGIERTLELARRADPTINKLEVEQCVDQCQVCRSIDPAPVQEPAGTLEVANNWERLAIDTTHFRGRLYLSITDCGPSRLTVWKLLPNETAAAVIDALSHVLWERGMPREILMDNSRTFHSDAFLDFLAVWGIEEVFRAADRPPGNGIAERIHRTIKRIAARSNISIFEACYWYNASSGRGSKPSPVEALYQYPWRYPMLDAQKKVAPVNRYKPGDVVWVKPRVVRCDQKWNQGVVTGIKSTYTIEVDGMARSIRDVRLCCKHDPENAVSIRNTRDSVNPLMWGGSVPVPESDGSQVAELDNSEFDSFSSDNAEEEEEEQEELDSDTSRDGNGQIPDQAAADSPPQMRTRSGRVVQRPGYLRDYDLTDD